MKPTLFHTMRFISASSVINQTFLQALFVLPGIHRAIVFQLSFSPWTETAWVSSWSSCSVQGLPILRSAIGVDVDPSKAHFPSKRSYLLFETTNNLVCLWSKDTHPTRTPALHRQPTMHLACPPYKLRRKSELTSHNPLPSYTRLPLMF